MELKFLLDTNAVIYLQKGLLKEPLPIGHYFISIITGIELLSFPNLDNASQNWLTQFIHDVHVVTLTDEIKDKAIQLRREYRLKLPDAVIGATAISLNAALVTHNMELGEPVPNLEIYRLKLQ